MATALIDLDKLEGSGVVFGWVRSARLASKDTLLFIDLDDGTTTMPCVVGTCPEIPDLKLLAATGTGLVLRGRFVKAPAKSTQSHEFKVDVVIHVGACDAEKYPLPKPGRPQMTLENLRSIPHLRMRDERIARGQRIRSVLTLATHQFFQGRRFLMAHTPVLTSSDCEGAGEMFRLDEAGTKFFADKPTYLTVSGQLEGEQMAIGGGLGRIYTFGPTFRAEESHTSRHLAEFWMIEPEWCCVDGIYELMNMAEDYIHACVDAVQHLVPAALVTMLSQRFGRMTYTAAIEKLQTQDATVQWGDDLTSEQEQWLCGDKPLIITHYPKAIKSFYMRVSEDERTVDAMDVLVPGIGELVGGSVREQRLDVLLARMVECGLDPEQYERYLDTRRFGTMPHCGFGLGFERLVRLLTGLDNIRDVIPFPRTAGKPAL